MGAQVSQAIKKARKLLRESPGTPQAEIARRVGCTSGAISKDSVCRAIRAAHPQPSKVAQGAALVEAGVMSQREAARQVGVHESAISKFRKRQQQQEKDDGENG